MNHAVVKAFAVDRPLLDGNAVGVFNANQKPMLIPEVDFSGVARVLGSESTIMRSLSDLSAPQDWIDAGAWGTTLADCRITSSVRAPWLSEWMKASQTTKAAAG